MKKTALLAAAADLALTAGAVAKPSAHPSLAAKLAHTKNAVHHVSPFSVLYDQNSNDDGIGPVSQNFLNSSFDIYDSQGADDFKVPHHSAWKVREVDVTGSYFNGSGVAPSENVIFYAKGKHHVPGDVVREFDGIQGTDDGFGSFAITLPGKGVTLKAGTYWVSVIANMDFFAGGEWGWETRADTLGSPGVWRNEGGGFGICADWTPVSECIPDGESDYLFTIQGDSH